MSESKIYLFCDLIHILLQQDTTVII